MKRPYLMMFVAVLAMVNCKNNKPSSESYLNPQLPAEKRVELLLNQMTLEEKIGQMCQYVGAPSRGEVVNKDEEVDYTLSLGERAELIKQGKIGSFLKVPTYKEANELQRLAEESRLKIPLLIATDAIHGHGMYQGAVTLYPTEIGLASSFDTNLAREVAKLTAREMRATGYHWTFSPNIEVVRDARWGRTGESFGEDTYLTTQMGIAMIEGYQGTDFSADDNVLACAKHFLGGGISNTGINAGVADVSERTLKEVFFPPFEEAVELGVYSIMPAHNEINGVPCHAHKEYLDNLMRETWGFEGIYVSDWMDIERLETTHRVVESPIEASQIAVEAGLDIHMHGPGFFDHLLELVSDGKLSESRIDESVRKILFAKFQLGLFEKRFVDSAVVKQTLLHPTHLELAIQSARKSIVLLKNEKNTLPLKQDTRSVFITGPNANNQGLLGDWARIQPEENVTTLLEGMIEEAPKDVRIDYLPCDSYVAYSPAFISEATTKAKKSDIVVLALGDNSIRFDNTKTLGENLDRSTLELVGDQLKLLQAMIETGTPVVVVLVNGGPIASPYMVENAEAIIEAWEPGMLGGKAVAEVVFGKYNPGGRMPITVPYSVGHLKNYYNLKPSEYHRGRFFGSTSEPLYPFGHGLSYTQFEYKKLKVNEHVKANFDVQLSFTLSNVGPYDGDEVVLVYLNDKVSSVTTPVKKLVAFNRIELQKGEEQEVMITIDAKHFGLYDVDMNFVFEPGEFEIILGDGKLIKQVMMQ